ncbi:uncharacterized protein LOC110176548 [Drosophila serrata]|uniref:uncharacterized protein LOC110176548 n=1 Tax=Drosophila serrata TaxID=7274 RepID=UPI000A1D05CC|nr:uncharacterized protein LOC110176548 [Drosophila serrata]
MFNSKTVLFYALIALYLKGSQARSHDSPSSVCLLEDAPIQCGEFVLANLTPLFQHIKDLQHFNSSHVIQAKLARLEVQQSALKQSFEGSLEWMKNHQSDSQETLQETVATRLDRIEGLLEKLAGKLGAT